MATSADWRKIEAQGEIRVSPNFLHDQFTGVMKGDSPSDRRVLSAITGWGSYRLEESDAVLEQLGLEGLGLAEVNTPEDWSNIQLGYFDDIAANPKTAPHLGIHPLDYTPEQMEDVIMWLATLSEKELRRRQTINIKQTEYVLTELRKHPFWEKIQKGEYHTLLTQGLETLDIRARLLQEAMLTKV